MKLVLKNKKVAIIAGVSAAVLVTALGVGLGVGLSGNDSQTSKSYYSTVTGIGISNEDIKTGKLELNENEYSIRQMNGNAFLEIPSFSGSIAPIIKVANMFNVEGKPYKENTTKGEGKGNFYDLNYILPSLSIGVVRIPNDGKIYGGFIESTSGDIDYKVDPKLEKVFPNGYDIGNFNTYFSSVPDVPGGAFHLGIGGGYYYDGGINMLKLQKLKTLLDTSETLNSEADVDAALSNVETTTRFGFFLQTVNGENVIKMATNSEPTKPSEIGYVPNVFDAPITLDDKYKSTSVNPTIQELSQRDYNFPINSFKDNENQRLSLTLTQGTQNLSEATQEVELNDLYINITYEPRDFTHPILGLLKPNVEGTIPLDESIVSESGESIAIELNPDSTFTSPTIFMKFIKNTFDDSKYGTYATSRKSDELFINVWPDFLDYFKNTLNDPRVKKLSQETGITIRFKKSESYYADEWENMAGIGIENPTISEVFFLKESLIEYFETLEKSDFAPLLENGVLKKNLDNPDYFNDGLRRITKFFDEEVDRNKYGAYPLSKNTQIIAYNSDYLPNGLDFSNGKTLASYLYQDDLGNLDAVKATASADSVTDEQKRGLLINPQFSTGGTVWALNYYSETKKDQQPNEQDVAWKKVSRGSGDTDDPRILITDQFLLIQI